MSPTRFAVRKAQLNAELETARLAGNIKRMQVALAGLTNLYRAMYG
jgi:hypothetical protein